MPRRDEAPRRGRARQRETRRTTYIPKPNRQRTGAVVLVQEDRREYASSPLPLLGLVPALGGARLLELDRGPQIIDVRDAQALQGADSVVRQLGRVRRSEDETVARDLARLPRDGESAEIAAIQHARDGDEGRRGKRLRSTHGDEIFSLISCEIQIFRGRRRIFGRMSQI